MYVCKLQPAYDNTGEQVIWQSLSLLQIKYLFWLKGQTTILSSLLLKNANLLQTTPNNIFKLFPVMFIYHNIIIEDALGAMCKAIPHSRRKLLLDLAKNAVSGNSEWHPKKEIRCVC